MKYRIFLCLFVLCSLFPVISIQQIAQADDDVYAEYTIEEGDFLSVVAMMFNTSVDDILSINQISDVNAISIGTRIKIPSMKGIEGTISTRYLNIGDTLSSLSILSGMEEKKLAEINSLVSPTELYIGSLLTTIANPSSGNIAPAAMFNDGVTLLETAARNGLKEDALVKINRGNGSWDFSDRQTLFSKNSDGAKSGSSISPYIDIIEIKPLPLVQGETFVIHISSSEDFSIGGSLGDQGLHFYKDEGTTDSYAMIGIDAMADPGLIQLKINGTSTSGNAFSVEQPVVLTAGIFTNEVVEGVDPSTLEAENQQKDTDLVHSLITSSPAKRWGTMFSYPVDEPCFASAFGSRRSYNDGSFYNFHSGIDYSVCLADNINIYAVADGTVVFAGEMPIHGNYTVIDHGWGVFSTYSHQSQQVVSVGQEVKRGELIGLIGSTGRSVGPHLHLEVVINGVFVNPLTWLGTSFP